MPTNYNLSWNQYPAVIPPVKGEYRAKFRTGHVYKLTFDGKWEWSDTWRKSTPPVAWSFLG